MKPVPVTQPSERTDVVVLFADDFDEAVARRFIDDWSRGKDPRSILILVTTDPTLPEHLAGDPLGVVLRRPIWGWVLRDAIRSALAKPSQPSDELSPWVLP